MVLKQGWPSLRAAFTWQCKRKSLQRSGFQWGVVSGKRFHNILEVAHHSILHIFSGKHSASGVNEWNSLIQWGLQRRIKWSTSYFNRLTLYSIMQQNLFKYFYPGWKLQTWVLTLDASANLQFWGTCDRGLWVANHLSSFSQSECDKWYLMWKTLRVATHGLPTSHSIATEQRTGGIWRNKLQ